MKLHCHRPSLMTAFTIVNTVVPSRTPREILKNVKLQVVGGAATLIGTDQEVGIRYQIPGVETQSEGETLLPTARVLSILRELGDESVDIEVEQDRVWIRSGHSEFRLSAEDPAEFPTVAEFAEEKYHVADGETLKEAIRRTIFATDIESTRYALGGVLLELGSDSMALVATDSRRLALVKIPCQSHGVEQPENNTPVVPRAAMSLIEKSIGEDCEVRLAVHANDVLVQCGNSTIYSRLVDGRFPRYGDVIPAEATHVVDLVTGPFYSAVRQAQIVTNEDSRGVDFTFDDGTLTLHSEAADIGTSKVDLPISYDEDAMTIKFDPRFLAEFLRVLEPETQVHWHLIDDESAAVLRTDDDYTYVIMPLSRDN
jgi:DNA polymerase-3 subunit beta